MSRAFTGSQYLEYVGCPGLLTVTPLTLAAWFNVTVVTGYPFFLYLGQNIGGTNCFGIGLANAIFRAYSSQGSSGTAASISSGASANVWIHGIGIFTSNVLRAAFVNGARKATDTTDKTPVASSMNRMAIGNDYWGDYISGRVADAAIWNVALTDAEAAQVGGGASPLSIRPDKLICYWPLIGVGSVERNMAPLTGGKFKMTNYGSTLAAPPPLRWAAPAPRRRYFFAPSAPSGYTLAAACGAFAEAGNAASLLAARRLPADTGAFSETGVPASLLAARRLPAAPAAFGETGNAAGLLAARLLSAAPGAVSETGMNVSLLAGRRLPTAAGAFSEAGQTASLLAARKLSAEAGALALTGLPASLLAARQFSLAPGAFTETGSNVSLLAARRLPIAAGEFTLSGSNVSVLAARRLAAAQGDFSLTGRDTRLLAARVLRAGYGEFALAGHAAAMRVGGSSGGASIAAILEALQESDN